MSCIETKEIIIKSIERMSQSIKLTVDHPNASLQDYFSLTYTLHLPPLHHSLSRDLFPLRLGDRHFITYCTDVNEPRILKLDAHDLSKYWSYLDSEPTLRLMMQAIPGSLEFHNLFETIKTSFSLYNANINGYTLTDVVRLSVYHADDASVLRFIPSLIHVLLSVWFVRKRCHSSYCLMQASIQCLKCHLSYCGPLGCIIYHDCWSLADVNDHVSDVDKNK